MTLLTDTNQKAKERNSRSPRRPGVLKVTPLSPIIGTPNKEPESQEVAFEEARNTTMSPSRIPVRSNSISRPMSRSNTTLGVTTNTPKTQGSLQTASRWVGNHSCNNCPYMADINYLMRINFKMPWSRGLFNILFNNFCCPAINCC